jgi:hypothetical protein
MNCSAFLITYLSPDALAAFRLASPGAFAGPFKRQLFELSRRLRLRSLRSHFPAATEFPHNGSESLRHSGLASALYSKLFVGSAGRFGPFCPHNAH